MGATNYIVFAIPVFFLLIGIEILIARLKQTQYYRFNDAVTNISCGIGQQILGIFLKTFLALGYIYLYENYRFTDILTADRWWVWVVCFVGVDFFYYWFHRYAHEISIMWGGHIVHHQSEEYNLSVALRQGAFQSSFSWVFYLPLGLIGFDPIVFVIMNQFQTLYQFWIHTRAIDRMPAWFEFVFNTPSHHRVHHGINPKYIDRNHGGTLIIFDRMFGTFQAEEEEVVYGVTKPLNSWNPVWANLDYFRDVLKLAFQTRTPLDFIKVFLMPPGWRPEYLGGPQKPQEIRPEDFEKYDTEVPRGLNYYVLFQYVILLGGATGFLIFSGKFETLFEGWAVVGWLAAVAALIFFSISNLGALLAARRWALYAEAFRFVCLAAVAFVLGGKAALAWPIFGLAIALGLGSGYWLSRYSTSFPAAETAATTTPTE